MSAKELIREIHVNAPPETVAGSWLNPDDLATWFAQKANVESRVGGAYELFWNPANPEVDSTIGCSITELDLPHLLAFTWKGPSHLAAVMNAEPLTRVSVRFIPQEAGTLVRVVHEGWGESEAWQKARSWHEMAWDGVLKSMKSFLETRAGQSG